MEKFRISEGAGQFAGQEAQRISVAGQLDGSTIQQFEQTLDRAVSAGEGNLVVDFDGLEYISSAGIGVLLGVREAAHQKGGEIRIVNMPAHIRRIFDVLGFSKVITIVDDEASAGADPQKQ